MSRDDLMPLGLCLTDPGGRGHAARDATASHPRQHPSVVKKNMIHITVTSYPTVLNFIFLFLGLSQYAEQESNKK